MTRIEKTKGLWVHRRLWAPVQWLAGTPPSVLEDESKQYEDSRQTNVNDRNVYVMFGIPIKQR